MIPEPKVSFKLLRAAVAITGCPPKVVICPRIGLVLNNFIFS